MGSQFQIFLPSWNPSPLSMIVMVFFQQDIRTLGNPRTPQFLDTLSVPNKFYHVLEKYHLLSFAATGRAFPGTPQAWHFIFPWLGIALDASKPLSLVSPICWAFQAAAAAAPWFYGMLICSTPCSHQESAYPWMMSQSFPVLTMSFKVLPPNLLLASNFFSFFFFF